MKRKESERELKASAGVVTQRRLFRARTYSETKKYRE